MEDKYYKRLIEEVTGMREEIGRIDRDLAIERRNWGDLRIEVGQNSAQIKQLRDELLVIGERVKDRVVDALEPAVDEVKELKATIKRKKVLVIKDRFDLAGFIKFKLMSLWHG